MSDTSNIIVDEIPSMPEVCLVRLSGALDVDSIANIDRCFPERDDSGKKHAIADMSNVSLVASAALGKLLGIKRRFIERGGDLVLAAMSLELKMKFMLMGVNKIFKVYNDLRSAMNAYAWDVKHETEHLRISFPPQLSIVPAVRNFVSRVMVNKGYSDRDSFRIETIVDEICNNAVQYGSPERKDNIMLRIKVDWGKVELDAENVTSRDEKDKLRKHMDGLKNNIPLKGESTRGRGLALVKMLASELNAEITDTGTMVHVTKLKEE
ncbi:MAG: ATP-binding protein [Chitinispirillaceae bacterium]|nr:ATP-binding protein [Chitinispirillaceae bacterium]